MSVVLVGHHANAACCQRTTRLPGNRNVLPNYIYRLYYYYKKQLLQKYNFPSKGKAILPSAFQYFQHVHFIPKVGVGKSGACYLVHGDLPRQHSFGTTLRFTGSVAVNSRQ